MEHMMCEAYNCRINFRLYYVPGTIINRPVTYIIFPNATNSPIDRYFNSPHFTAEEKEALAWFYYLTILHWDLEFESSSLASV